MTKFLDKDFLHATARIRSIENSMLGRRQLQKMLDARSFDEAFKVLNDAGIAIGLAPAQYEDGLTQSLAEAYALVAQLSPDKGVVQIFRYKYDGHNIKTIIKAQKTGGQYEEILTDLGNVPLKTLKTELENGKFEHVNPILAAAALEATEALAKTGDPQTVDILIDKAVLTAMWKQASGYDNAYLHKMVGAQVDLANIRATVRIKRMSKDVFFLRKVLVPGPMDISKLTDAFAKGMEDIAGVIAISNYGKALEPALDALRTGAAITSFERMCDDYIISLLSTAKLISFGVEPLIAYIYAKESEIQSARIVLASKLAGVPSQQITERLRESYAQ